MSAELALTAGDLTVEFDGAGECDDLTADEAEVVTSRIRRWVNDFPVDDVVLAFRGRVWIALAYASWSEWCECELGGLRLPAPKRRAVAAGLASQGISNVAIGSALGVTEGTVRNDLASQNYEADRKRLGQDGKSGEPEGWNPDEEWVAQYGREFFWPSTKREYRSEKAAKSRAKLIEHFGATAKVVRSSLITWPEPS